MKSAALYARVASTQQGGERTIASQTAVLAEFARRSRFEIREDCICEDEGYSGMTLERPGLERLRNLAAHGRIQAVFVYSPDRLSRTCAHQSLLIEEFHRNGAEIWSVIGPDGEVALCEHETRCRGDMTE
jgi:site-specific DNA recombinase